MSIKILVADDHPFMLEGLKTFLNNMGHSDVLTSLDGLQAYNTIIKEKPEIVISDFHMPKLNGLELAKLCSNEKIKVKVILLTLQRSELILKEVGETIEGYLLKEDALEKIEECIQAINNNELYVSSNIRESSLGKIITSDIIKDLTASEIKILNQMAKSKSSQEIANALFISVRTVEKHRSNIIKKLGLPKSGKTLNEFVLLNKEKFKF